MRRHIGIWFDADARCCRHARLEGLSDRFLCHLHCANTCQWIFVWEGVLTCIVAGIGYIFLVGFPDDFKSSTRGFLTEKERRFIIARVNADRGDADTEPFNLKKFLGAGLDLKIWGFAIIFCCTTTISYALAFFLPLILRQGMGFSIGASQCLVCIIEGGEEVKSEKKNYGNSMLLGKFTANHETGGAPLRICRHSDV